jgi:hypothetical protein
MPAAQFSSPLVSDVADRMEVTEWYTVPVRSLYTLLGPESSRVKFQLLKAASASWEEFKIQLPHLYHILPSKKPQCKGTRAKASHTKGFRP